MWTNKNFKSRKIIQYLIVSHPAAIVIWIDTDGYHCFALDFSLKFLTFPNITNSHIVKITVVRHSVSEASGESKPAVWHTLRCYWSLV